MAALGAYLNQLLGTERQKGRESRSAGRGQREREECESASERGHRHRQLEKDGASLS
jgi:hypothetical protein